MDLLTESEALETLLLRLAELHPQRSYLDRQLDRIDGGARGEQRLKASFKEFWIDDEFSVLRNVNLALGDRLVQMDGLLLTERCAVIIESKNISGKIHFDNLTGELFRIDQEGDKTIMEDPEVQLDKHIRFLTRWSRLRKISLPVTGLAVFTAKQCEFTSKPVGTPICKTYQMPSYLLGIWQSFPQNAANPKPSKISEQLLIHQTPFRQNPLCQQYSINPADLKVGVLCSTCKTFTMKRVKRGWTCVQCSKRDASAHEFTVREYFTLVNSVLTNQELRRFCGLELVYAASRLLSQ